MINFISNILSRKGQRVSIISIFNVRYEGLLYAITDQYVILKEVKNFGHYNGSVNSDEMQYYEQEKLIIQLNQIKDVMPIEEVFKRKIIKIHNQDISLSNSRCSIPQLPVIKLSQHDTRRNTDENNHSCFVDVTINQSMLLENSKQLRSASVHRDRYSQFANKESDLNIIQGKQLQYKRSIGSTSCVKKYRNSPSRYFPKSETPVLFDVAMFINKNSEDYQNYNFLTNKQQQQTKPFQSQKHYIQRKYY